MPLLPLRFGQNLPMKRLTPILLALFTTVLISGFLILSAPSTGHTQSLGGFSQRRVAILEFQNISVAVSRGLFAQILGLIGRLRPLAHPT